MQYEIKGEPTPVVVCNVEAGESLICEKGAMVWMSPNMRMDTQTAGANQAGGLLGGIAKAAGSMLSGESLFQNKYTAEQGPGMIAFGSSFMGSIVPVEITPDRPIVAQKKAFLAATPGVELSVFFQKKLGAGLFGGEGFIMQKLSGSGIAFLEIDGSTVEYQLAPGQQLIVDNGYVAIIDSTVSIDVQMVKGLKNMAFGGEGLTNMVLTGPGKVVLQTMPISNLASSIIPYIPKSN